MQNSKDRRMISTGKRIPTTFPHDFFSSRTIPTICFNRFLKYVIKKYISARKIIRSFVRISHQRATRCHVMSPFALWLQKKMSLSRRLNRNASTLHFSLSLSSPHANNVDRIGIKNTTKTFHSIMPHASLTKPNQKNRQDRHYK